MGFAMLRSCMSCRHEKQVVTADNDMLQLLNRIALYKQRSTMLFEVAISCTDLKVIKSIFLAQHKMALHLQGTEYVLGDFTIRLCRTILRPGEEVKGIAMDVEYMAGSNAAMAHSALEVSSQLVLHQYMTGRITLTGPADACRSHLPS